MEYIMGCLWSIMEYKGREWNIYRISRNIYGIPKEYNVISMKSHGTSWDIVESHGISMAYRGICVRPVVDLWNVKTTPRVVSLKWMAKLKVASRKLHAFADRRDTDIWDCGSLQQIIEYMYIYIYI